MHPLLNRATARDASSVPGPHLRLLDAPVVHVPDCRDALREERRDCEGHCCVWDVVAVVVHGLELLPKRGGPRDGDGVRLPLHPRPHETHDLGEADVALERVGAAALDRDRAARDGRPGQEVRSAASDSRRIMDAADGG